MLLVSGSLGLLQEFSLLAAVSPSRKPFELAFLLFMRVDKGLEARLRLGEIYYIKHLGRRQGHAFMICSLDMSLAI